MSSILNDTIYKVSQATGAVSPYLAFDLNTRRPAVDDSPKTVMDYVNSLNEENPTTPHNFYHFNNGNLDVYKRQVCHCLIIESAIQHKTGASGLKMTLLRIGMAFIAAALMNLILPKHMTGRLFLPPAGVSPETWAEAGPVSYTHLKVPWLYRPPPDSVRSGLHSGNRDRLEADPRSMGQRICDRSGRRLPGICLLYTSGPSQYGCPMPTRL